MNIKKILSALLALLTVASLAACASDADTGAADTTAADNVETTTAEVLAADQEGRPVFTMNRYGKGKVYFCAYSLEMEAGCKAGVISGDHAVPYYKFYEAMGLRNPEKQFALIEGDTQYVGLTEHPAEDGSAVLVLVNYTPEERTVTVDTAGWKMRYLQYFTAGEAREGDGTLKITLPGNTGAAVVLAK